MGKNSGYWSSGEGAPPECAMVLHSCGQQTFDEPLPGASRPQGRADHQLIYLYKGAGLFGREGKQRLEAGTAYFYAPGEPQFYHYSAGTVAYYVHFSGGAAAALLQNAGLTSGHPYEVGTGEFFCTLFEKIIKELQAKPPLYRQCSISYFTELVAAISRNSRPSRHNITNATYQSILRVIESMHKDYAGTEEIAAYAAMCSLSKYYFAHCFQSITGDSPISYRNKIRLDKAKELLEEDLLPISEIAARTGFESASYFSKAFKKQEGLSPLAYKQKTCGR